MIKCLGTVLLEDDYPEDLNDQPSFECKRSCFNLVFSDSDKLSLLIRSLKWFWLTALESSSLFSKLKFIGSIL